jgi:hypothetical protein
MAFDRPLWSVEGLFYWGIRIAPRTVGEFWKQMQLRVGTGRRLTVVLSRFRWQIGIVTLP